MRGSRFEDGEDPIQVAFAFLTPSNLFLVDRPDFQQRRPDVRRHRQDRHQQGLDPASPPLNTSFSSPVRTFLFVKIYLINKIKNKKTENEKTEISIS